MSDNAYVLDPVNLLIPLYLDTTTMLDLLATIENGYSVGDKITTETLSSTDGSVSAGGGFGFGAFVSFMKVQGKTQAGSNERIEEERTFTLGSLLARLRSSLLEAACLTTVDDQNSWDSLKVSDIIEFRGRFQPNPLLASADRVRKFIALSEQMSALQSMNLGGSVAKATASGSSSRTSKVGGKNNGRSNFEPLYGYLDNLLSSADDDPSMLFVVDSTSLQGHRAIVSLFPSLMRAKTGIELPDGEFRLLGKVARITETGDAIDLLRGTPLAGLGDSLVEGLIKPFNDIGSMLKLPTIVTSIQPPAVSVVPIAIYV